MFKDGFEKIAKSYFIYRNINKGKDKYVYSLRAKDTGRVEGHESELYLKDPKFSVGTKGRDRVKSTGVKNVHAGIRGEKITQVPETLEWKRVTYDPKKHHGFINRETLEPITQADYASLTPEGVFVADRATK